MEGSREDVVDGTWERLARSRPRTSQMIRHEGCDCHTLSRMTHPCNMSHTDLLDHDLAWSGLMAHCVVCLCKAIEKDSRWGDYPVDQFRRLWTDGESEGGSATR